MPEEMGKVCKEGFQKAVQKGMCISTALGRWLHLLGKVMSYKQWRQSSSLTFDTSAVQFGDL